MGVAFMACAGPSAVDVPMQERGAAPAPKANAVEAPGADDEPVAATGGWMADEAFGVALARKSGKPVLLNFDAAWCAACKQLERETFPDAQVQAALRKVVAIRVDATDDEAPETARLRKKYAVVVMPTMIVLDRSGKEVARATEFVPAAKLTAMLAKAER